MFVSLAQKKKTAGIGSLKWLATLGEGRRTGERGMKRLMVMVTITLCATLYGGENLEAGYSLDPWGSKTWTGPGRPPHWSPEKKKTSPSPGKPVQPIVPERPVDPGYGVHPGKPGKPFRPGGYWKDRYNRWYYHKRWRPGYIYYREPRVETIIIEKEKPVRVPVYVSPPATPSKLQCGGTTVTKRDPVTGDITIEYVTQAKDCP